VRKLRTVPSSCKAELRHARDERHQGSCESTQLLGPGAREASMRQSSRPRRFDWPAARHPELLETRSSMSVIFLKAALPPSCYRTGKTAAAPLPRRCAVRPGPACRFAWPSGGTEEFLGRWPTRSNSWCTEAKGALADPPYVFGAVGRTVGNRNDRTSRRRQTGQRSLLEGYLFKTEVGQVGNSGVRALTLVSIYVFDSILFAAPLSPFRIG